MYKWQIEKSIELFDAGKSLKEISEAVGRSMGRVSEALTSNGRSAWNRRYPDTAGRDEDAMILDYQNYMPLEQILRKYHIGQTTLYRRLREREIEQRRKKPSIAGPNNHQYKHGKGDRSRERTPELTKQVAAICLGHVVPKGWHIHHADGNPKNNNPGNLIVFPSGSHHGRFHQELLNCQREGSVEDMARLVSESGGIVLHPPDRPLTIERERGRLDPQ